MLGIFIPVKIHTERITREDKKLANDLDYDGTELAVCEKILARLKKNNICINVFCYKTQWIVACNWWKERVNQGL